MLTISPSDLEGGNCEHVVYFPHASAIAPVPRPGVSVRSTHCAAAIRRLTNCIEPAFFLDTVLPGTYQNAPVWNIVSSSMKHFTAKRLPLEHQHTGCKPTQTVVHHRQSTDTRRPGDQYHANQAIGGSTKLVAGHEPRTSAPLDARRRCWLFPGHGGHGFASTAAEGPLPVHVCPALTLSV